MPQLPPTNQVILTGELTEEPSVHYLAPDFPEVRLRLRPRRKSRGAKVVVPTSSDSIIASSRAVKQG